MSAKVIRVTYVFDVMCGWCHVSRPLVDKLFRELDRFPEVECQALHRRLFTGAHILTISPAFVAEVRRVGWTVGPKMTGQHFSEELVTLITRPGFRYESHWSSIACAAVEFTNPERSFEFSRALQKAFFEKGRDVTDPNECLKVVDELGLPMNAVAYEMEGEQTRNRAEAAAAAGRLLQSRVGSSGVPALVAELGERATSLPHYEPERALGLIRGMLTSDEEVSASP